MIAFTDEFLLVQVSCCGPLIMTLLMAALKKLCCMLVVEDDSLFYKANRWLALFTGCCYCDVYLPWSREAYVTIAERWLSNEALTVIHFNSINVKNIM